MELKKDIKDFLIKTVTFIKDNVTIIYSLFLLILIPAAFLANTHYASSKYEEVIDLATQKKVAMITDTINSFTRGRTGETAYMQAAIDNFTKEEDEVLLLSVLVPTAEGDFKVVASSDKDSIGEVQTIKDSPQNGYAWNSLEGTPMTLDANDGGRFIKAARVLFDESGQRVGVVNFWFSIANQDLLINQTISDAYLILFVTVLIVLLLVVNQARLVAYAAAMSHLKEVDKMKDMFISMASHELRSPLTAVKGYMELLTGSKTLNLDAETGRYVENINTSIQRLNNLVEDILDVSRLEGNRLPIEITDFDPMPSISKSVEEMRAAAIQKGLALNFNPGEAAMIRADESRVKQVVVNLIGNAVKYTEKGSVDISTAAKGTEFVVTIADTGIGMSADDQKNLFQKFYRIKNDKTRMIQGTGLGLWITKEVVEKMGGKISVESIENVGSHFIVRLPISTSVSKKQNLKVS